MKKIFLILFVMLVWAPPYYTIAQSSNCSNSFSGAEPLTKYNHLSFNGLQIDGSITEFQKKLLNKGIQHDKALSAELPVGQRMFKGKFNGQNADVTVFYNRKTSLVYKVKVEVLFNDMQTAQNFLDKTIQEIEKTNVFTANHDLTDSKELEFNFNILESVETKLLKGEIIIKPTTSYLMDNRGNIEGKNPAIIIYYQDAQNQSLLTPSTREPRSPLFIIHSTEDYFLKNAGWAANYKANYCYAQFITRMYYLLDCYKYNFGVQEDLSLSENYIEQSILQAEEHHFADIKTAYNKEITSVYIFKHAETNELAFIEYSVNDNTHTVKLNKLQIIDQIAALSKLRELYIAKSNSLTDKQRNDYWSEKLNITLPVTFGKERYSYKGFGDIEWQDIQLSTKFGYNTKRGLRLEVNDEYFPVLWFWSVEDIDDYMKVLQVAIQ